MSIPKRRFGVEIECYNLPYYEVVAWSLTRKGLQSYTLSDNSCQQAYTYWEVNFDNSISGPSNRIELKSPILTGAKGLAEVRQACHVLKSLGAKTNGSCGLHVHVSIDHLRPRHLFSILGRYARWEEKIDKFVATSRRKSKNGACVSVQRDWNDAMALYNDPEKRELFFQSNFNFASTVKSGHCKKVDFDSVWDKKTIEFRHHHGTVDPYGVSNWIRFCLNFVEVSADLAPGPGSRRSKKRTIDTGPLMGLPSRVQDYFRWQEKKLR